MTSDSRAPKNQQAKLGMPIYIRKNFHYPKLFTLPMKKQKNEKIHKKMKK